MKSLESCLLRNSFAVMNYCQALYLGTALSVGHLWLYSNNKLVSSNFTVITNLSVTLTKMLENLRPFKRY